MSQKPFMWNENNAVESTDPSGYATSQGLDGSGATDQHAQPLFADYYLGDPGALQAVSNSTLQLEDRLKNDNQRTDPQNGTYKNYDAVAKAAASHYGDVISSLHAGQEVGCGLYCTGSGCGYELGTLGDDNATNVPLYDRDHALWHAHPVGDTLSSTEDHDLNAAGFMRSTGAPFSIYTTLTSGQGISTLTGQVYERIPAPGDPPVPTDILQ